MTLFARLALLTTLVPAVASAQAPRTLSELVNVIVVIINNATAVLVVLGLVVYFYGVSTNILNFGSEDSKEKIRAYFVWGIIVLFVMVSIWGIVQILQETLFGGDTYSQILQGNSAPSQPQFNLPVYPQ
jgi:hypothetical protein